MITGQIKNQIDQIWDTFWTGGITTSITLLEQMTYLFFMKMLNDNQIRKEQIANAICETVQEPEFAYRSWHNSDTGRDVDMQSLRWSNFKHFDPERMFRTVREDVFAYIKYLGGKFPKVAEFVSLLHEAITAA